MSTIINALKAHALQQAHSIEIDDEASEEKVEKSYQLAKNFNKEICPKCWVKYELTSKLIITAFSNVSNINIYKCESEKCDFNYIFPKM